MVYLGSIPPHSHDSGEILGQVLLWLSELVQQHHYHNILDNLGVFVCQFHAQQNIHHRVQRIFLQFDDKLPGLWAADPWWELNENEGDSHPNVQTGDTKYLRFAVLNQLFLKI